MEFIDGAGRLKGGAKALDIWRIETKLEAGPTNSWSLSMFRSLSRMRSDGFFRLSGGTVLAVDRREGPRAAVGVRYRLCHWDLRPKTLGRRVSGAGVGNRAVFEWQAG